MWMVFFRFANLSTQISSVIILSKRSQRSRVCAERTHAAFRLHLIPNLKRLPEKVQAAFQQLQSPKAACNHNQSTHQQKDET